MCRPFGIRCIATCRPSRMGLFAVWRHCVIQKLRKMELKADSIHKTKTISLPKAAGERHLKRSIQILPATVSLSLKESWRRMTAACGLNQTVRGKARRFSWRYLLNDE